MCTSLQVARTKDAGIQTRAIATAKSIAARGDTPFHGPHGLLQPNPARPTSPTPRDPAPHTTPPTDRPYLSCRLLQPKLRLPCLLLLLVVVLLLQSQGRRGAGGCEAGTQFAPQPASHVVGGAFGGSAAGAWRVQFGKHRAAWWHGGGGAAVMVVQRRKSWEEFGGRVQRLWERG